MAAAALFDADQDWKYENCCEVVEKELAILARAESLKWKDDEKQGPADKVAAKSQHSDIENMLEQAISGKLNLRSSLGQKFARDKMGG